MINARQDRREEESDRIGDATRHEVVVKMPLVAATVALGVLPAILLEVTGPAVRALLAGAP